MEVGQEVFIGDRWQFIGIKLLPYKQIAVKQQNYEERNVCDIL
jgi:hypothetical protein